MNNSILTLEILSKHLQTHVSYYKYNKQKNLTEKYKKGRVDASLWLNELIYFFLQQEKNFLKDFEKEVKNQKDKIQKLKNLEYKQGLLDELNTIQEMIYDRNSK